MSDRNGEGTGMGAEAVELSSTWTRGAPLGSGGFGKVCEAEGSSPAAVIKLVPKQPGADRELLFVDLDGARNVVPVIDSGEHDGQWAIVMPRADYSLREYLDEHGGVLDPSEAMVVLADVATALVDLDGKVVHRDLKPENVLYLDGRWCVADFGISRYAEASTAPDTHKWSMSPPYAAPERWRAERASSAADVYALGVIAFELLAGRRPFAGPSVEDYREQHLHADAPALIGAQAGLAALVDECLFKSPAARPAPANLLARLSKQRSAPVSGALAALAAANHAEVQRLARADREATTAASAAEQRRERQEASRLTLTRVSSALWEAITVAAPAAVATALRAGSWHIELGQAKLTFSSADERAFGWGGWHPPAFVVDAAANLSLRIPAGRDGYEGRSHSLWFGDVQAPGQFGWFETAFMVTPLSSQRGRQDPFALDPGEQAAKAVWNGMAGYQMAWPFTRLDPDDLDEFIERWAGWFAAAATGRLFHPSQMPERSTQGSWRRK